MTVTLTSDASSIIVGQSITFDVTFEPMLQLVIPNGPVAPDGSQYLFSFAQVGARFSSGDGQAMNSTSIGPSSGGHITFTYLVPGDYIASAYGAAYYGVTHCTSPGICSLVPGTGFAMFEFNAIESIIVSVPEPATWILMLMALWVFGFTRLRSLRP